MKMEKQKLLLCPICRDPLQKAMKAIKLPKNFIALEIAKKNGGLQSVNQENYFCKQHEKEVNRYFCNQCEDFICAECIIDHSGHEFVRREESSHVINDNVKLIKKTIESSCLETKSLIDKA